MLTSICNSSRDQSLNIFENLNLDDSSLNNYRREHSNVIIEDDGNNASLNEKNLNAGNFMDLPKNPNSIEEYSKKFKEMEELLIAKDTAIAALNAELESVRDIASNPSTMSLGTNTTEYKQYHEEYHGRVSF